MPNESIFPTRGLPSAARGITVFGGDDALVNVEPLQNKARGALGDILGGVTQVINKAMPAALAACASVQFRGTQGSFRSFLTPIRLTSRYINIAPDRSDFIGYPTARSMQLSACDGFVLCENAVIAISGTIVEERAIEDMLNLGVFVE